MTWILPCRCSRARTSDWDNDLSFVKETLDMNFPESSSSDSSDSYDFSSSDSEFFKIALLADSDSMEWDNLSDSEAKEDPFDPEGQSGEVAEWYAVMNRLKPLTDRSNPFKSKDFAENYFANLPPNLFRDWTRMNKESFFALVRKIEDHPVFTDNIVDEEQSSVAWQLAVTLDRLGHDGPILSSYNIPALGANNGLVDIFTTRCFKALKDKIRNQVKWPGPNERARISREFAKKGFPACVGLIDGTLISLSQEPKYLVDFYHFFDRRRQYSLNVQLVCDHRQKILNLYTGMPGSCGDLTCFKKSQLWHFCNQTGNNHCFGDGQYVLGDKGYSAALHLPQ
ncbi:unnamed protein product [Calypogeia fissa]